MVGAARAAGRRLAVVHNYIPRPDFAAVKRVLDSGAIGRIGGDAEFPGRPGRPRAGRI
jgi:predicted dehydrogenase